MDLEDLIAKKNEFLQEIVKYETVLVMGHNHDDVDKVASQKIMYSILTGRGVKNVYLMQDPYMHFDVRVLCEEFDWKFHNKDNPLPNKPDAIVLVDTHLHDNVTIPKYDHAGTAVEVDLHSVPIYCFDHHPESKKSREDIKYEIKINIPEYKACVSLICDLFKDEPVCKNPDPQLSTAIIQALYIDTNNFSKLDPASVRLYRLAHQNNIIELNEQSLKVKKMTEAEAATWSRVFNPIRRTSANNLVSICYIGRPSANIIAQAADTLIRRVEGIKDLSLVAGGIPSDKSHITGSVRARADNQPVSAAKLAKIFNIYCGGDKCGGKDTQAHIEIDCGILGNSLDTPEFKEFFLNEADGLVSDSGLEGTVRRSDLVRIVSKKTTTTIDEMLNRDLSLESERVQDILSKSQYGKKRSGNRYITVSLNLFKDMPEEVVHLAEYDLLHMLTVNENIAKNWGSKAFLGAKSNLVYGMITLNIDNDHVVPYILAVHCYKNNNGNEKDVFEQIFGTNCDCHTIIENINKSPHIIDIYKLPLMRVNFMNNLAQLQRIAYEEIRIRIEKVLGRD